jgi:hypothetical protein
MGPDRMIQKGFSGIMRHLMDHTKEGLADTAELVERVLRFLAASLATPFLLLAALAIGCWLRATGKLTEKLVRDAGDFNRRPPGL